MAIYGQGFDITVVAGADLSAQQYKPVNLSGTLAGSADNVFGVLQNKPRDAEHATVRKQGTTKIYLPCSLGDGALIMGSNANSGQIALATSGYCAFGEIVYSAPSGSIATAYLYGGPVRRLIG
jgi:hypothetical protein